MQVRTTPMGVRTTPITTAEESRTVEDRTESRARDETREHAGKEVVTRPSSFPAAVGEGGRSDVMVGCARVSDGVFFVYQCT
mmetsp:Transcript_46183/g.144828  ORF Transcript_46183/g.144828 Transcript_46183/m.144828 type:complete len:82 (+) Transcript_46183:1175-1420(+)